MKYDIQFTNQFKKDLKLAKKQNKNLDKLFEVIDILANGGTLEAKYRDHDLTGNCCTLCRNVVIFRKFHVTP